MIIYITRKFPPSIGGMQRFNDKLYNNLKSLVDVQLISWGGTQHILPFFVLYAFFKALTIGMTKKVDCIYVSDGLLSPLGVMLKTVLKKPAVCSIHGRDIAFPLKIYQHTVSRALSKMDKIICVSERLKGECIKRNIPGGLITVIPNGVDSEDFRIVPTEQHIKLIETIIGGSLADRRIMLTVGRLVPKKGVDLFIKNTLPRIVNDNDHALYLIAGEGPQREMIRSLIKVHDLQRHAFLLGNINMDSGLLRALYNMAHVFVMPNVRVEDDMEGFGIVALEAGVAALPVVASNVDGIAQAVSDTRNGYLIDENDHGRFADTVLSLINNEEKRKNFGQQARNYVTEKFSWKSISEQYAEIFRSYSQK